MFCTGAIVGLSAMVLWVSKMWTAHVGLRMACCFLMTLCIKTLNDKITVQAGSDLIVRKEAAAPDHSFLIQEARVSRMTEKLGNDILEVAIL